MVGENVVVEDVCVERYKRVLIIIILVNIVSVMILSVFIMVDLFVEVCIMF